MGRNKSSCHLPERLHPGHLGLWGGRGLPRISAHRGSSSFQTGWPSLAIPPLSSGLCWPSSPRDSGRAHCLGPNCSNCGSSFQKGRWAASRAPDPALASVGTHQWLPRDLQVIEGQKSKGLRKRMERSKIRVQGGKAVLGRPIGPSSPHQLTLGQEGTNLPTNLPNGNPSRLARVPRSL